MINNKVYIGQSKNPEHRFVSHCSRAKNDEDNSPIHAAIKKYGKENFTLEIIEWTDDYNNRERYWIKYYDSYYNGYNSTLGGDQPYRINYDKVVELWNNGMSITEIARTMGHDDGAISRILKNMSGITNEKIHERMRKNMRSITDEQVLEQWNKGLTPHQIHQQIGSTPETIKEILLENGITEQEWKIRANNNNRGTNPQQVLELWKQGLCLSDIYRTIYPNHTSMHTKTIKKQLKEMGITDEELRGRQYANTNRNARPVVQLTLKGEYVATYPSGRQAEIQSGVAKSQAISACCNHKPKAKTAGGYKWMFKTEYDALNK